MKATYFFYILCIALVLSGCSAVPGKSGNASENTWEESGSVTIGDILTVQKSDSRMNLLDNMDALTADGLYYAAWTMGDTSPYENSDGDIVDLYDAQLYLLLGEFRDEADAGRSRDKWLDAARINYEVSEEEEVSCNGQAYSLLTYNCVSEDNPYARGVSAFGTCQKNAMCMELTCQEDFDEDLKAILIDFLNNCTYGQK